MTAESVRRAGNPAGAVDLCRDALARFPGHLSARVTLGWALLDLGRFREARVEFETVRLKAPDNLAAIRGLAELHTLQDADAFHAPDSESFEPLEFAPPAPDPLEPVPCVEAPVVLSRPPHLLRLERWLRQVEAHRAALTECA
jgi:hypothetical protein